ncbi:thiamine pyrophosphate-dependent enzyme [Lutispora sp.]|nr:thiamine pyrophosphate-dependent enzyme [Lutispora sp.]MEA4960574.1 thiamine pyrophosphate-dependent enzyme [Lutispora sp.]
MEKEQLLSKGMTTCEGCPMELIARASLEVLGPNTVTMTPPSCSAILTGGGDETGWGIPSVQTVLASLPAYASGISEALKIQGKEDVNILGFAGDGGTFDIGLQALSGAIERGHKAIFLCYNNEAYMNTGNQRSSATSLGAWTKTTPTGKKEPGKNIDFMLLHQNLDYQATASVANIKDLKRKVEKASRQKGPSFIHVHAPCNTGWKFPASKTITVAKLAVRSGLWLLWEKENGRVKLNQRPVDWNLADEYIRMQGRFDKITDEVIEQIKTEARNRYNNLLKMEEIECL